MAEKTVRESHEVVLETPPSPTEKTGAYHEESVARAARAERNVGLRIDGDDLDHEHEPKVRPAFSFRI